MSKFNPKPYLLSLLLLLLAACSSPASLTVESFGAEQASITAGESVTLTWQLKGSTPGFQELLYGAATPQLTLEPIGLDVSGQSSATVTPNETTTYALMLHGQGQPLAQFTVTVAQPQPTPDPEPEPEPEPKPEPEPEPSNEAPTAGAQSLSTEEDTALAITLSGSDPEDGALSFSVVSEPEHGTLSGTAPELTYTPEANYFGSDSFSFTVSDGELESEVATVSLAVTAVNDAPTLELTSPSAAGDYTMATKVELAATANDAEEGDLSASIVWTSDKDGELGTGAALSLLLSYGAHTLTASVTDADGATTSASVNIEVAFRVAGGPTTLANGFGHALYLREDGTVLAWGYTGDGASTVPADLSEVVSVAAGVYHSLALKADGTVVAWGNNSWGQSSVPADLGEVVAVAAGFMHSLALKADGTVVAWGSNDRGQLDVPADLTDVVAITSGYSHALALKTDGTVVAWGRNWDDSSPVTVPAGLTDVVAISAGVDFSVAVKADGSVVAWGDSYYPSSNNSLNVPADLTGVVSVSSGFFHTLALKADGMVVAWGGSGSVGESSVPADLSEVVSVAAGGQFSLARKADGSVVGWGSNYYGETSIPAELQ